LKTHQEQLLLFKSLVPKTNREVLTESNGYYISNQ